MWCVLLLLMMQLWCGQPICAVTIFGILLLREGQWGGVVHMHQRLSTTEWNGTDGYAADACLWNQLYVGISWWTMWSWWIVFGWMSGFHQRTNLLLSDMDHGTWRRGYFPVLSHKLRRDFCEKLEKCVQMSLKSVLITIWYCDIRSVKEKCYWRFSENDFRIKPGFFVLFLLYNRAFSTNTDLRFLQSRRVRLATKRSTNATKWLENCNSRAILRGQLLLLYKKISS